METRSQLWQRLRSLRADPPGLAQTPDRRKLFNAALEQSEQLLRGAEYLGAATKPINIFYGLSQGGRALAAALSDENRGRLSGHGITHRGGFDRALAEIRLVDAGEEFGSFTSIARLRRAPSLPAAVPLGDLLAALPLTSPGHPSWEGRPTALIVQHIDQNTPVSGVFSKAVFAHTAPWPAADELHHDDVGTRRAWVMQHIKAHFPTLEGTTPLPDEYPWARTVGGSSQVAVRLDLENAVGSDMLRREALHSRTRRFGDAHFASPSVVPDGPATDPFVTLWAVLWAFSMLARYEPVRWSRALDIDQSKDATGLEEILNDSLDFIPWLLLDTLDRLQD